jgi:membrane protease YdiL (CAAX protease family)
MAEGSTNKSPLKFFILVFVFSVPFWVLGAYTEQLAAMLPIALPISSLMVVCPIGAAVILIRLENGPGSIKPFLKRAFDYQRIKNPAWYLPIIFLMPAVMLLSYGLMRLAGWPIPAETMIPWLELPIFFVVFFIAAIGEEMGWTAYATDPMQAHWNALVTGLVLGLIWSIWHAIPFYQVHPDLGWVFWQSAGLITLRLIIVWLYNNTGSVFSAILFHSMINVSNFAFPNYGSHYDPAVSFFIQGAVAIVIVFLWGAETLAQYRFSPAPKTLQE